MTYEEALRKATLLLRKAEGTNSPEESALFAAKAQEIMDRYQIEKISTEYETGHKEPDEPIQNFDREEVITACQKDKQWTNRLAQIVAKANGCSMYFRDRAGGCATFLVGRASDVQTARYMTNMLANEVRRLNRECCQGYSDKYRRDFKYGVVDAINFKLQEQWNKTKTEVQAEATNSMALVRVNNAISKLEQRLADIEKWTQANMNLRTGRSNYRTQADARQHGFTAGQSIRISGAKAGIAGGGKALGR